MSIDVTQFVTLANYAANRPVDGEVVAVLASSHEARGLTLISTYTRALRRNSIHELIATDEPRRRQATRSIGLPTLPSSRSAEAVW